MKLKQAWLVPFAAAVAIAAALTLSRVALGRAQASPGAPVVTGIPRYFAIATEGKVSHDEMASITVTVGDVHTGKTVATVALPAISEIEGTNAAVGVSAAGDDRTFVVGRRDVWGDTDFFLVHIAPGAKTVATVRHLPIPETAYGAVLASAVSPNGRELAVLSVRGKGTTLRTYSVGSGAVVRTWTAAAWQYQGTQGWLADVSWTADSRQVGFSTVPSAQPYPSAGALQERLVDAAAPSGNLVTRSRVVLKAPGRCSSLLLTPDGGTVVCGTQVNLLSTASTASCGTARPMFVAYSARTGQRLRVLYQYPGTCRSAVYSVLWSDSAARHVIGEAYTTFTSDPPYTDRYGVAAGGKFTKFAIPRLGQWWSGPAF
jgi:hypothetical protein